MTIALIVIAAIVFVVIVAFLVFFNRLVRLRNRAKNAWHQIDVQLKRRYDLLPEFARVVQGYAQHEKETFESVTAARNQAMNESNVGQKGTAEDGLTGAISSVFMVAENYPSLKADQEFRDFAKEIATTENRIAGARKYYNGAVMYYENACQGFPGNIVVKMMKGRFPTLEYFEMQDRALAAVPGVDL
jgi:LemA protein